MATITTRKTKAGIATHRVSIRRVGHPPVTQTFRRLADAHAWADEVEKALAAGGWIGEAAPGDLAFAAALERYLMEVSPGKAVLTRLREETAAIRLREFFAGQTLGGINTELVAQYRDRRLRAVSPSTLQKELALLSHLYTVARAEWGLIAVNPVSDLRRPAMARGRVRMLERAEIANLLSACRKSRNKKLAPYVLLMLSTAMRPSEAAGLTWAQVDLDRRILDLTVTKTEPRRVPLTVPAVELLAEIMPEDCTPSAHVFLPARPSLRLQRRPNLYFRKCYDTAVTAAGISDFTMHDLRHTAASYLLMAGVDLRTLAEILGHKTMSMVQRYTHFLDSHKLRAIDGLEHIGG